MSETRAALDSSDSFEGGAFHESFDKGKAAGRLYLEGDVIRFVPDSGGAEVVLPLEDVELSSGGASNRLVFVKSPLQPAWSLFTHERRLLKHPSLKRLSHTSRQVSGIGRQRWLASAFAFGVLGLLVICLLGLWLLKDPLVALAASKVPVSMEEKIGETAFAQLTLGRTLLDSKEVQEAVDEMVGPLIEAIGNERYEIEVHVLDDPSVNAFALPGGTTVLHTGLILKAETVEEILGVMAHEIAHVTEQHSMRNLIQAGGVTLALSVVFGDVGGIAGVLVNNSAFLLQMSFSRDHEREADEVGMAYLVEAGIDPRGLVSFFERLRALEIEASEEGGIDMSVPGMEMLSTHPATEDRIAALEKAIDELPENSYQKSSFDLPAFQELVRKELE